MNDAVFKAAIDLLREKPFLDISIGEIAAHSGVHETTLYRRWVCKEAIFIEAIFAYYMKEVIPIPDTGSLRLDLIQWMQEAMEFYKSPLGLSFIQIGGYAAQDPNRKPVLLSYWSNRVKVVSTIFKRAQQRGEIILGIDSVMILEVMSGWMQSRRIMSGKPLNRHSCEQIVDFVLGAVHHKTK